MRILVIALAMLTLISSLGGCAGRAAPGVAVVVSAQQGMRELPRVPPSKKGEACVLNILSLVTIGDASIDKAKRDGGITQVSSVDHDIFGINILYLVFGKTCVVVRGT
jgi:hypothetical protein